MFGITRGTPFHREHHGIAKNSFSPDISIFYPDTGGFAVFYTDNHGQQKVTVVSKPEELSRLISWIVQNREENKL